MFDELQESELTELYRISPAFHRYFDLLERNSPSDFSDQLRLKRHRHWCKAAADSLLDRKSAEDICLNWSLASDGIIREAWDKCGLFEDGLVCLGLGKLGAQELNLSSDIDLVVVSESPCPQILEGRVREFAKLLSETTAFGFCHRVDFDLRPGGRFGPLVPSRSRCIDHYWNHGQVWERLALVRSRTICGQESLGLELQEQFRSFSYRKYINYSLFEDLKTLRSDIFQFRPQTTNGNFHLKLAEGAIRDIELFIHALQVVHGGRITALQTRSTSEAARQLIKGGCGDPDDLSFLIQLYWRLRTVENKVQAIEDSQTHLLRSDFSFADANELRSSCEKSKAIVEEILGGVDSGEALPKESEKWLKHLGFSDYVIDRTWKDLLNTTSRSSRKAQDEIIRQRLIRIFVEQLAQGIDPDLGLQYLNDFIHSVRAKTSFFRLLIQEQKLLSDLASVFSTTPRLSQFFIHRPELLDSFVFNLSSPESFEGEDYLDQLFEQKLLADVRYGMDFLRTGDHHSFTGKLSALADRTMDQLLTFETQSQDSDLCFLKLGKWAGRELGLKSDLDLVFLTTEDSYQTDFKIARRILSRMTEGHRGGAFYEIDLRLRPTGSAGPLLLTKNKLLNYLKDKAEPWERQSYLRNRSLFDITPDIQSVILDRGLSRQDLKGLREIRNRLYKHPTDGVDLKYQPGGLLDIEFCSQIAAICAGVPQDDCSTEGILRGLGFDDIAQSYSRLRAFEQSFQLISDIGNTQIREGTQELRRFERFLGAQKGEWLRETQKFLDLNAKKLKDLDPIWTSV